MLQKCTKFIFEWKIFHIGGVRRAVGGLGGGYCWIGDRGGVGGVCGYVSTNGVSVWMYGRAAMNICNPL